MKGPRDLTRLMRLNQTKGMPLATIIDNRLVCKSDWIKFCGAVYRNNSRDWRKGLDGSMVYTGKSPSSYLLGER